MPPVRSVESLILNLRGQKVLLDADLAAIYGVPTKALNQAVKRNAERFPEDFVFQLDSEEKAEVVTNCDHLSRIKFSKSLPYAFTEHGALMAANVLNSPDAVRMSVHVVRAFIKQREALQIIWQELQPLLAPPPEPPKPEIGFHVREPGTKYTVKPRRKIQP